MLNLLVFYITIFIVYIIGVIINFVLVMDIIKDFIYNDLYRDYIFIIDNSHNNFKNYFIIIIDLIILIFGILGSFLTTIFIINFIDNSKL